MLNPLLKSRFTQEFMRFGWINKFPTRK